MEIIKATNENIEPIQLNNEEMTKRSMAKYKAISMKDAIEINLIAPQFDLLVQEKEIELGLKVNLWNGGQLEKLRTEFIEKYLI
jgi:hypothetical protein